MSQSKITAQELAAFRAKLGVWGQSLSAGEGAVLESVLDRAGAASTELTNEALDSVAGGAPIVRLPGLPARGWVRAGNPWVRQIKPRPPKFNPWD